MAIIQTTAHRIRGVVSSVPIHKFDNLADTTAFDREEVQKVVRMAGVKTRHTVHESQCSSDLCIGAARRLMERLDWAPGSVDALIFVTQTPDYILPSTCCLAHRQLGLGDHCAALDVGLGCSGYPYGLSVAGMMLQNPGIRRVLLLHGETPTRFTDESDRAVALLFGDAGSATAIERDPEPGERRWTFSLHTDGAGYQDLLIEGGGFRNRFPKEPRNYCVQMNGANVFNFTIKRVPTLIDTTLEASGEAREAIDYYIFHQSNQFMMRHLSKKAMIPESKVPMVIDRYGSVGGPSIPLTMTEGQLDRGNDRNLKLMLLGYGVGLSWGSAVLELPSDAILEHIALTP